MKVLITGAGGQLANELIQQAPADVEYRALARSDLDICDVEAVSSTIDLFQPNVVINAAAYTAVDKAESDSELTFAVNERGAKNIALACPNECYLIHISTDFVFDGKQSFPYVPEDKTCPMGVYGESKLAGEKAVLSVKPNNSMIIRTSWVYSSFGANFVKTMLRLMAEKPALGVVCDQVGSPTWARGLASVCWQAARTPVDGVFHWSDAGVTSWYDFAVEIQQAALELGLLAEEIPVNPIPASAYPTPAARPSYSVLDKSKILEALPQLTNKHWRKELLSMLNEYKLSLNK